jgi:hypothetical protein
METETKIVTSFADLKAFGKPSQRTGIVTRADIGQGGTRSKATGKQNGSVSFTMMVNHVVATLDERQPFFSSAGKTRKFQKFFQLVNLACANMNFKLQLKNGAK